MKETPEAVAERLLPCENNTGPNGIDCPPGIEFPCDNCAKRPAVAAEIAKLQAENKRLKGVISADDERLRIAAKPEGGET